MGIQPVSSAQKVVACFLAISEEALMRYKAKSIAALQLALGSLPDKMRVEIEPDTGVSAKTVGELREGSCMAGEFGDNNAAGAQSREYGKSEQG